MTGREPIALCGLLSRALVDLAGEFDAVATDIADARDRPNIVLWSNFGRLFDDDRPVRRRDLPKQARLSRRAMKSTVARLEWIGWITVAPDPDRPRDRLVTLNEAGRRAFAAWRARGPAVEAAWRARVGDDRVDRLRGALERLVGQFDLELPHYPTGYGAADVSMTGAASTHPSHPAEPGPPRLPPRGDDWHPVLRTRDDTVSALPLSALLSQALVAFAIDYESHGFGAILFAADVLPLIDDAGIPRRDAPPAGAISGDGRSVLERHGIVVVDPPGPGPDGDRLVRLTARGRQQRDAYGPLTREVEARWADRFGTDAVAALRAALEALDPTRDPTLPHFPIVRFELGLGFTEASHRAHVTRSPR
jgi:DNA-binding MarR family transcriptional regulator